MPERLRKSDKDKVLFGVAGGLAEYVRIDSTLVRVAFVLLAFASGIGILVYIVLALLMPPPLPNGRAGSPPPPGQPAEPGTVGPAPERRYETEEEAQRRRNTLGILLIVFGLIFLAFTLNLFWWLSWRYIWPALLILAGVLLIVGRLGRPRRE